MTEDVTEGRLFDRLRMTGTTGSSSKGLMNPKPLNLEPIHL
jgi:hypothetical protein